jgi:hypothetical protein
LANQALHDAGLPEDGTGAAPEHVCGRHDSQAR